MKIPVVKLVWNRRKNASKNKASMVEIEVAYEGKRKIRSTGIALYKGEWNDRSGVIGREDMEELNDMLNAMVGRLRKNIHACIEQKKRIDEHMIDVWLDRKDEAHNVSFVGFWEDILEKRPTGDSTKVQHKSVLNIFKEFGKIEYFADLIQENILEWDVWLRDRGLKQSSIASKHKVVKVYIHEAMKRGVLDKDPYMNITVKRGERTKINYLTENEVKMVEEWEPLGMMTEHARDLFVVQCYTGLAYADLMKTDWSEIKKRGGHYYIRDNRQKTAEEYFITLLPPVMKVLEKYEMRLPEMSNQKYNMALKVMGEALGLKTRLTTHVGRHSFAVMMINNGIPISVVARAMGHSTTKTTEIYATVLGKNVEDAFLELGRKLGME